MIVGRFAPSPTGPLHMGSLLTALASYLDVKSQGGHWFVRLDDIDPPRQDPLAGTAILTTLQAHGLTGDRPVDYQSQHTERYQRALTQLLTDCFYCTCSRRMLAGTRVYPGHCRAHREERPDAAIRLRCHNRTISFDDGLLGHSNCRLDAEHGDYVIKRRDGLWAYHLATAVDDGNDVTHVMRGQDLFATTPLHIDIMQRLGLSVPTYAHLPLVRFADGSKLSKQTHAPALDTSRAGANLQLALNLLGQEPPAEERNPAAWLDWGQRRWDLAKVPKALPVFTQNP